MSKEVPGVIPALYAPIVSLKNETFLINKQKDIVDLFEAVKAVIICCELPDKTVTEQSDKILAQMEVERLAFAVYKNITGKNSCI